jgi:hypothetical protein
MTPLPLPLLLLYSTLLPLLRPLPPLRLPLQLLRLRLQTLLHPMLRLVRACTTSG